MFCGFVLRDIPLTTQTVNFSHNILWHHHLTQRLSWQLGLIVRVPRVLYKATLIARHFSFSLLGWLTITHSFRLPWSTGMRLQFAKLTSQRCFIRVFSRLGNLRYSLPFLLVTELLLSWLRLDSNQRLRSIHWFYQVLLTTIFYIIIIPKFLRFCNF